MNKLASILVHAAVLFVCSTCEHRDIDMSLDLFEEPTIFDYLVENQGEYSGFLRILEAGKLDRTLSGYNPNGDDYTLFLPGNEAVTEFLQTGGYTSIEELLDDSAYVSLLGRYHVLNSGIRTDEFPFGIISEPTLSGDYLSLNAYVGPDASYYLINNQAPVKRTNIELSNGYIHTIDKLLVPFTFTTYDWLVTNSDEYSIYMEAMELTGLQAAFNTIILDKLKGSDAVTLLVEADSVFSRHGIHSIGDLVDAISPDDTDYTSGDNPLNLFVAYHLLKGKYLLSDFEGVDANYDNHADVPVNISGLDRFDHEIDPVINKDRGVIDTLFNEGDTILIKYVGFYYEESNIITASGPVHLIDNMLSVLTPIPATYTFQFLEESLIYEYSFEPGTYLIEDTASMIRLKWWGTDLTYFKSSDEDEPASNGDYIMVNGDFVISYRLPPIVPGNYRAVIRVRASDQDNAVIQCSIDGKLIEIHNDIEATITRYGSYPYGPIRTGKLTFSTYSEHTITISSLVAGNFGWDYIRLVPD